MKIEKIQKLVFLEILLINLDDDSVQIIDRQNTDPIAFKRFIDRDLFEGSGINFKLLDFSVENALKPVHAVKFNRGSLQKIYSYTRENLLEYCKMDTYAMVKILGKLNELG